MTNQQATAKADTLDLPQSGFYSTHFDDAVNVSPADVQAHLRKFEKAMQGTDAPELKK